MAELIRGMPMEEYQAIKALSAGGIHTLVEECPWRVGVDPHEIPNGYSDAKHRALESTISRLPPPDFYDDDDGDPEDC